MIISIDNTSWPANANIKTHDVANDIHNNVLGTGRQLLEVHFWKASDYVVEEGEYEWTEEGSLIAKCVIAGKMDDELSDKLYEIGNKIYNKYGVEVDFISQI